MHVLTIRKMLSQCHVLLVIVMSSIAIGQLSVPSPNRGVSKAAAFIPVPLDEIEFSSLPSPHGRRRSKVGPTTKADVRSRVAAPTGHIAFKFLHRGPNYEILPLRVSAVALHAFYTSISHLASTVWSQTVSPVTIFTITQGALQLTISSLGTVVPWDFVEDWAMRAAESVARGWTDTFDAVYEVEATGVRVWVSLRLLEGGMGNEDAMNVS